MTAEQRSAILSALNEIETPVEYAKNLHNIIDADIIPVLNRSLVEYRKDRDATKLYLNAGSSIEALTSMLDAIGYLLMKADEATDHISKAVFDIKI